GFLKPSRSSTVSTRARTTLRISSPTSSTRSTFNPTLVSSSATWRADTDPRSTWSASQDTGARTSGLHAERERDAHVAFDQIADVGQVVPGHQRPLQAHPEGEAGVV